MTPHPMGAPGKEPLCPNTSPFRAPRSDAIGPNIEPQASQGVDTMNTLIQMVILNNKWVRRLNSVRSLGRLDPREGPSVLEDEEESPVPTLDTFLVIQLA